MTEPSLFSPLDRAVHPPHLHPAYTSTVKRAPHQPLVPLPQTLSELTAPVYGAEAVRPLDHDLTRNAMRDGEPIGERIIVTGCVLDDIGRPVSNTLIEIWQANAAGRYIHKLDQHDAPLDPNFTGAGRVLTNDRGEYRFITLRPGAYPWKNHTNAWRPAHIHFSVFGDNLPSRLVTQMYFPGDPLLPLDPLYNGIPDPRGRERLIAGYAHDVTQPLIALGYRFDIVLCGARMTPFETDALEVTMKFLEQTPSQTVGPFFHYGLIFGGENILVADATAGNRIMLTGRVLDSDGIAVPDALVEIWQADAAGRYRHPADPRHGEADPHFRYFGRSATSHETNYFTFKTIKPGGVADPGGHRQAPHITVRLFARGLLLHLHTRIYFADEADANAADPFLNSLPPARRSSLLAQPVGCSCYAFDIVLQGAAETVFLI